MKVYNYVILILGCISFIRLITEFAHLKKEDNEYVNAKGVSFLFVLALIMYVAVILYECFYK